MTTENMNPGASAPPDGTAAAARRETLRTLVRREFWEHPALWLAPLIVAVVLALCTLFSMTVGVHVDEANVDLLDPAARVFVLNMSQTLWVAILALVAGVVSSFYALDCLYAERKDRSILFWKSLPVSDGLTVLSKFLVIVVVVPLGVFVLSSASHLVGLFIWKLRVVSGSAPNVPLWNTIAWLRGETLILLCLILASLWYAPLVAAAMLLSGWVKKSPVLWSTLLLLLLCIFEYLVFRTKYVWHFIEYRSGGIWDLLAHRDGRSLVTGPGRLLTDLNWGAAFTSVDLWLGLLASAAMLYAAARIRRYRDDT